ncbi:MAG: hypothetical protein E7408_06490 [Ruminococcaceae bacterium]|nr:hypothetical protein [Oscillospiraceae bacterium]
MEILRLCAIGITAALLSVLLKQHKSALAIPVSLAGGCLLLFRTVPYLRDLFAFAGEFASKTGLDTAYIGALIRVVLVTFVTECAAALCRDAGESALATNLEIAGKLIILGLSAPVISSLFETVIAVLP